MINIKLKILLNLVLFILVLPLTLTVYANEDQVPYSVKAVLPENQINDDVSYFDIGMNTEEELNLEVIIQNYSAEEITINITNNTATTNSNGLITYDGVDAEPHSSMNYPFNELSTLSSDEVKVSAESEKSVTLNVKATPLSNGNHNINNAVHFIEDNNDRVLSESTDTLIAQKDPEAGNVQTLSWGAEEGILLKLNPIQAQADTEYSSTITWTLTDGP